MKTYKFTVKITVDDSVLEREAHEYIDDAVSAYGGQYHPDNPFFGSNKKVKVTRYRNKIGYNKTKEI